MKLAWFLLAHGAIVFTWIIVLIAMIGLGGTLRRLSGRRGFTRDDALISFFVGLAIAIGFLQIWNLLLPINATAEAIVLGAGLLACLSHLNRLMRIIGAGVKCRRMEVLVFLAAAIWTANRSMSPADLWDTKMYHINAVRWASEYPAIPGIVNLQRNIAFNNASHLVAAMLNHGFWRDRTQHLVSGLFVLPLLGAGICGLGQIIRKKPRKQLVFYALCLPMMFCLIIRPEISGLSSDVPAVVLSIISIGTMIRFFSRRGRKSHADAICLTLIFLAAICCKLSTIGLAGAGLAIVFARALGSAGTRRAIPGMVTALAIMLGGFMARGVVQSGYPLFPMSIGAMNVEWKYPADDLASLQKWIAAYGRGTSAEEHKNGIAPASWLKEWAAETTSRELDRALPSVILICGGAVVFLMNRKMQRNLWLVLVPAATGVVVWFVTAPAMRFGFHFPWILGAVLLCLANGRSSGKVLIAFVVIASVFTVFFHSMLDHPTPAKVFSRLFARPGPDRGMHAPPPGKYVTFTSRWGVKVYVPETGDFCWDAPLPCSHLKNASLKMRDLTDLSQGFVSQ